MLTQSPCSDESACFGAGTTAGIAAGDYFLIVYDSNVESPGCGAYTLNGSGSLGSGVDNEIYQSTFDP